MAAAANAQLAMTDPDATIDFKPVSGQPARGLAARVQDIKYADLTTQGAAPGNMKIVR